MRALIAALLMPAALLAQETSPQGFANVEGNFFRPLWSFKTVPERHQQLDATQIGQPRAIAGISFRRNGDPAGGRIGPRTFDLEIWMGEADMSNLGPEPDPNYLPGTKQLVFTKKQVSLPDWSGFAGSPSQFDFPIDFDTTFSYSGQNALVIDWQWSNASAQFSGYGDGVKGSYGVRAPKQSFSGCTVSGQAQPFRHFIGLFNNGASYGALGMSIDFSVTGGPASSAAVLAISATDPAIQHPALCTTLHVDPIVQLPVVTNAAGAVAETLISFPYYAPGIGTDLYTQLLALDPGQPGLPVALSDAHRTEMPSATASNAGPIATVVKQGSNSGLLLWTYGSIILLR